GFYLIKDLFPKSLLPLLLCSSQNQNRHFNHCWILSFCSLSSSIRGHRTFLLIMDRGWIREPKFSKRYVEGVQSFMQLVRSHFDRNSKVRCPCQDCLNVFFQTQEIVYDHLLIKGIMGSYMQWIYHGEQSQMRYDNEDENEEHDNDDEIQTMLEEVSGRSFANFSDETKTDNNVCGNMSEMEAKFFDKLLEEAERELYPGCNLSGWSTKGYMACPTCNKDASSQKVRSKICYMGHRRHLEPSHSWRRSKKFDGKKENRSKPKELSGDDVLHQLDLLSTDRVGKHSNNKKKKRRPEELNWVRRSILFELPYWKSLKLRHNLDVMHIEKNICESILGTLLNIDGKTKDTHKARQDLKDMNIRKELWLQHDGSTYTMPAACYVMSKKEKKEF
ncbi:hypothetical protein AABB24_007665, partial [Solanum stoloniferum]